MHQIVFHSMKDSGKNSITGPEISKLQYVYRLSDCYNIPFLSIKPVHDFQVANAATIALHVHCLSLLPSTGCWYICHDQKNALYSLWLAPVSQTLFVKTPLLVSKLTDLDSTSQGSNMYLFSLENMSALLIGNTKATFWKGTKALL